MVTIVLGKGHYYVIAVVLFFTSLLLVAAYNPLSASPSSFGHTPNEVDWNYPVEATIRLGGASPTYKITNVITPTDSSDVATKGYVDAQIAGSAGAIIVIERGVSSFTPACPSGWIAVETGYWNCGVGSAGEAGGGCFCGRSVEHSFQDIGGTRSSFYTSHSSGTFYYRCTICGK